MLVIMKEIIPSGAPPTPCTSAPHRGEDAFGVVGTQLIVFSLMAKEECKEIAKK